MGTQTTYFAYGYSGQNRPLIEGINTTEGTAAAGFYLDYGSFEEVFIGAAANSAEMPNPGVLTQFVGKSGSNCRRSSLYFDYENDEIPGKNLDADQSLPTCHRRDHPSRRQPPGELQEPQPRPRRPVVKDKVWGFYGYLNQRNSVAAPPVGLASSTVRRSTPSCSTTPARAPTR